MFIAKDVHFTWCVQEKPENSDCGGAGAFSLDGLQPGDKGALFSV
jgi:hypothetical protein